MTVIDWVAAIELNEPTPTLDRTDSLMDALAPWDVSVAETRAGRAEVTITIPSRSLAQATRTALAVVNEVADPVGVQVMTEADRDLRVSWVDVPDLMSVTQAAELMGVTRQRVDQLITSGHLPAVRVGNVRVLPRVTVIAALTSPEPDAG